MFAETIALIAILILGFGVVSGRLERSIITPPMVFVAFGLLIYFTGVLHVEVENEVVRILSEITLVLILFADAARINLRALRKEYHMPIRLLAIGMPLTVILGALVGRIFFPEFTWLELTILAAILAPTDAALGQVVVSSKQVPARVRQALNVESGLNDGIAFPLVIILVALAATKGEAGQTNSELAQFAVMQVFLGPIVGILVGFFGGRLVSFGINSGWMDGYFQRLAGLALALLAFSVAEIVGGNGFIAAFVAGLTMGNTARASCSNLYHFMEAEGQLLNLLVFLIFGAVLVVPAMQSIDMMGIIYVIISLTLIRLIPTFISMIGMKLSNWTILFLGWFGPRGIATIIFALLILETEEITAHNMLFTVAIVTVLFSTFAHGITAYPGANRYGAHAAEMADDDMPEFEEVTEMPIRMGMELMD